MGAPVSDCVVRAYRNVYLCLCVRLCMYFSGERLYLRVSAGQYLDVSVTVLIRVRVGVRAFHGYCVYKDLCCLGVCVLRIWEW